MTLLLLPLRCVPPNRSRSSGSFKFGADPAGSGSGMAWHGFRIRAEKSSPRGSDVARKKKKTFVSHIVRVVLLLVLVVL